MKGGSKEPSTASKYANQLQPAYPIENTHEQSLLDAWVIVGTMKKGWL
jgi:hypothetical protein